MEYTDLLIEADNLSLITKDKPLRANDGRIKGKRIAIRKGLPEIKKKCVLAEELGHYHTTVGNILDPSSIANIKQELHARAWAYDKLIGITGIIESYKKGCRSLHEVADQLDVTVEFLSEAILHYKRKYGVCTQIDNYVIYFEPTLGVFELI